MEEKVQNVLKLIEEDGDSFAKRAEMYYKKRPELIFFVEESYKAYRALAERYDHISTELQNASSTLASVFPDQYPFMDEDDDDGSPRTPRKLQEGFKQHNPKAPKPLLKDLKTAITTATGTRKFLAKKTSTTAAATPKVPQSGFSRKEALEEVEKLQKQILELQTVKEFVKSSYDSAISRYWETEQQIKELQERVSILQEELGEGIVIEDSVARRLMAEAALKSCQQTLTQLQVKREESLDETRIESTRIKDVKAKLGSLMDEFKYDQNNSKEPRAKRDVKEVAETKEVDKDVDRLTQETQELQSLKENIKQQFGDGSNSSLSVTDMAEKINELVSKVMNLENAVSSQTGLVQRLRTETDELHDQIQILESEKESLINDKKRLNDQLREMEEKLHDVQDLKQIVDDQNSNLQIQFTEARSDLDHLSEKVQNVQPDEEVKVTDSSQSSQTQRNPSDQAEPKYEPEGQDPLNQDNVLLNDVKSDKEIKVTSLLEDAVNSDEELKVASTVEDGERSDKEIKVTDSPENGVHTDNEVKVTDSSESSQTQRNPSDHAESKHEPEGQVPWNQDNVLLTDVKSDKEIKVTSLVEDGVRSDKELKVTGSPENGVHTDNELKATGSPEKGAHIYSELKTTDSAEKGAHRDNELKVTGSAEKGAHIDNELKVTGSAEKGAHIDNELKVTSSLEDDVKSGNEVKVISSLEMEEASPVENKSPEELKEQEKTLDHSKSDEKATVALTSTTDNWDRSQQLGSNKADCSSESFGKQQQNDVKQISSETDKTLKVDSQDQARSQEDEPDWKQLFMNGMQDREKVLLTQYTNTLRNYKDVKKRLAEIEKKNQDNPSDSSSQLKEMKATNALKDEEIRVLRQQIGLMQISFKGNENLAEEQNIEELLKVPHPESTASATEEKIRAHIDEILEENLAFWINFSASFSEIQKFETTIEDLLTEVSKVEEKSKSSEGSSNTEYSLKSDARPIYKHLTEIQAEITVWLEKSASLKEELQCRFSSLCGIQEEITAALRASAEDDDFNFTSYQAAKFQGEVLNMKQENNKVADELQAGLDAVASLQREVEEALVKLNEQFVLSTSKRRHSGQLKRAESKAKVPLSSLIFGAKPKKQSIFSYVTPGMHKKYQSLKTHSNI